MLFSFILLTVSNTEYQVQLLTWIFAMRILMIITSIVSFWINGVITKAKYENAVDLDFEKPLINLVWITSILSIIVTFIVSYFLVEPLPDQRWISLSVIISASALGAVVNPEFTKFFTSHKSTHVNEVAEASKQGGASLNILSGLVAGNFSTFW